MTFRNFSTLSLNLMVLAVAASVALTSGCALGEFDEEIDTQFTVPKPTVGVFGLEPFTKKKRFKFDSDPADADKATLRKASLQVLAPGAADLSIFDSVEVYADVGEQPVLLGNAEGFVPGERSRKFDIVFGGDLRPFVTEDKRVNLLFVVYPSSFANPATWPEEGITIRAEVTITIEVF